MIYHISHSTSWNQIPEGGMSGMEADFGASGHEALNDSLSTAAHDITLAQAEHIVAAHYGITGRAALLTSERDHNFKIVAADGAQYVLKVSNAAEDPQIAEFQVQALLHIERVDMRLPVPRVIGALNGQTHLRLPFTGTAAGADASDFTRSARLLTFLHGTPLHMVERTAAQRRALGTHLAQLGLALRGFFHPAAGHDLAWDIKNASRLRELVPHIPDAARRELVLHFIDNFEKHAKPHLPKLRAQVVHNDLNAYNVLVDDHAHDTIAGILDFGDMVYTSLLNDVAVGASYHVSTGERALDTAAEFIAAYHAVVALEPMEVDLLFDLIAARFVTTVVITGWRAARYPHNSTYILRNNPSAWSGLESLNAIPREEAQLKLRRACNME
jgi:hydroxylysine kinase